MNTSSKQTPPRRSAFFYVGIVLIGVGLFLGISCIVATMPRLDYFETQRLGLLGCAVLIFIGTVMVNSSPRRRGANVVASPRQPSPLAYLFAMLAAFSIIFPAMVFLGSNGADLRNIAGRVARNLAGVVCLLGFAMPFVGYCLDQNRRLSGKVKAWLAIVMFFFYVIGYAGFLVAIFLVDRID
jgi:hypothetical protein